MMVSSGTKTPRIHPSAYVAASAIVSGDVTVEEGCAVLHGAVLASEGAPLVVGANSVVMENAVLKASGGDALQFPLTIGESCIIGPNAYVVGATVEPGCFIAAGAKVYNGAVLVEGSSIAPGAVHPPESAGDAHVRAPFFESVFNVPQTDDAGAKAAEVYSRFLRKAHAQDAVIAETPKKAASKGPVLKSREEPAPTQSVEVEKVVDVMFVELEEARQRREAALDRQKKKK
ncbi:MAG: hypothetical protein M3R35_08090 [Candidatus Eremiobacteraeota bacterium]|nr:hypothetical protein [Candidatus Eremiobacteraeota bacterium]